MDAPVDAPVDAVKRGPGLFAAAEACGYRFALQSARQGIASCARARHRATSTVRSRPACVVVTRVSWLDDTFARGTQRSMRRAVTATATPSVASYQVLARKYRPQTFEDVAGQSNVVLTLKRALETGRVAHAFLFTGSRGVGKTTLARILARCLVCATGPTATPCGVCNLCMGVQSGALTDVVEIDGASNNSVDQIRDLQEMARFLPQLARVKIFIVDEVHMLSTSAFNALLKILEEPPPHVKFIFATTEPHKIPVTILSRCQRYDFKRLPQKTIVARLKHVLAQEHTSVSDAGIEVIAHAAEGGMRDALSLTDQVLSFAGANASAQQVAEALGIIDRRSVVAAVEAVLAGDAKAALDIVHAAHASGHDLRQLLSGVAQELRHLCVANATGTILGLADLTPEDSAHIDARARTLDSKDLLRVLAMTLDGMDPLARAEDPRLHLELVLLRICRRAPLSEALAISEAIVRLEALKAGKPVPPLAQLRPLDIVRAALAPAPTAPTPTAPAPTAPTPRAPAPTAPTPTAPAPTAPAPTAPAPVVAAVGEDPPWVVDEVPAGRASVVRAQPPKPFESNHDADEVDEGIDPAAGLPLLGVDARFIAFVDATAKSNRPLAMHLDQARVVSTNDSAVRVGFVRDLHERALAPALLDAVLLADLRAAYGAAVTLEIVKLIDGTAAAPSMAEARTAALAAAQAALEAHAKSHPVVAKAVALFGGPVRSVVRKGIA